MSLTRPKGQKSTFSEHCHVVYRIKGNRECSNMVTNILLADTPPPKVNLGGWRNGIYVLWFISFLRLPFVRDINLKYLPCLTSVWQGNTSLFRNSSVNNWYLFLFHVWKIGTSTSRMRRIGTNSSPREELVPIIHTCKESHLDI